MLTTIQEDSRRRSQTTLSSYDEAPTPRSSHSQGQFDIRFKPVEGPKGPHLFRASQSSADLAFGFALQMSPLFPSAAPDRVETAFSEETVTPIAQPREADYSIAAALSQAQINDDDENDAEAWIRNWSPQQVIAWMVGSEIDVSVVQCFEAHDINGAVLLDLQFEDLRELDIQSFGKRHQLWSAICDLRDDGQGRVSPQPTQFQDISRPCTTNTRRSPSRQRNACDTPVDDDATVTSPSAKKRRGRKAPRNHDVVTPAESISIVAIEQLLPKPHRCPKGARCAKLRQQQRQLKQLQDENGIGRFPISPTKGGRIFVAGDPGNAATADNIVPTVREQPLRSPLAVQTPVIPSMVASSDAFGPGELPDFRLTLHEDALNSVLQRDPQDNVRQFLNLQHMNSPAAPPDEAPPTPPADMYRSVRDPIARSESTPPLFPAQHYQPYSSLYTPVGALQPHEQLRSLPRLEIPRSQSAAPGLNKPTSATNVFSPASAATSICRSMTSSPPQIERFGTPASEMDVPVTAVPTGPISRDTSQSVPPNMLYRQTSRAQSRAGKRQSSAPLPALREGEVLLSAATHSRSTRPGMSKFSSGDSQTTSMSVRDPAKHSPTTQQFGYGADCTHAGWMKKRKTKMLRHEWQEAHCRLRGTQLGMYPNARLSTLAMDLINVDDYAVACSSVASGSKLSAAMKALHLKNAEDKRSRDADPTAFAFQLVPAAKEGERKAAANSKTHHFAVKTKDERIDWMRELMLAKALQAKGKGFEVEVNGVAA